MKKICALMSVLVFSGVASASSLNERALEALLSSQVSLRGDVHSYETIESIYANAQKSQARINNNCEVVRNTNKASCTLWLNFSPIGETALDYEVLLPGDQVISNFVTVSRGD